MSTSSAILKENISKLVVRVVKSHVRAEYETRLSISKIKTIGLLLSQQERDNIRSIVNW